MNARKPGRGPSRDAYLKLVRTFPLVSIESDEELSEAQEMLDSLLRAVSSTKAPRRISTR